MLWKLAGCVVFYVGSIAIFNELTIGLLVIGVLLGLLMFSSVYGHERN